MKAWGTRTRWLVVGVCLALAATPVVVEQVAKQVPSQAGAWDVSSAMRYNADGTVIGVPLPSLIQRDDDSAVIAAPFPIRFFDATYTKLCITTNGTIYPTNTSSSTCTGDYDLGVGELAMSGSAPIIAALATDQDTRKPLFIGKTPSVMPTGSVTGTSLSGSVLTVTTTADVSGLAVGDRVAFKGTGDSTLDGTGLAPGSNYLTLSAVDAVNKTFSGSLASGTPPATSVTQGTWMYARLNVIGTFSGTATSGANVTISALKTWTSGGTGSLLSSADQRLKVGDYVTFQSADTKLNGKVFPVTAVGDTTAVFTLPAGYTVASVPDTTATGTWFYSDGVGPVRSVNYGTTTVDGRDAAVITWYRAPQYSNDNDLTKFNTFQIVIVKRATGSDSAGWDLDIEFNYGKVTDDEDGYKTSNPASSCSDTYSSGVRTGTYDTCRFGVGWSDYKTVLIDKITYDATPTATITTVTPHGMEGTGNGVWIQLPNTGGAADLGNLTSNDRAFATVTGPNTLTFTPTTPKLPQDWVGSEPTLKMADSYELYADYTLDRIADGGNAALVSNSLNTAVLGRYTFRMIGGVTQGFQTLAQTRGEAPGSTPSAAPTPGPTGIPYDWESANSPDNPAFRVGESPSPTASPSGSQSTVTSGQDPGLGEVRTGETAALPPGRAVMYVNGQPTSVTVTRLAGGGGIGISGSGTSIILAGRGSDGDPLGLNPDGVLLLQSLQGAPSANLRASAKAGTVQPVVEIRGDGYDPNRPVKLYLLSYGYMGEVLADSNGDFFGHVTMPEGIASGSHVLQANGYNPMREVRSLSLGVEVTGSSASQLATKRASGMVTFAPGSTKLTKKSQAAVKAVLAKAGKGSVVKVSVVGFGPKTGNTLLAAKRAQAVAAYLKSLGLTATITADGSGVAKATSRKARQVAITISHT